jgi:hypothetical protein
MSTIVNRAIKDAPLTNNEVDDNFGNLNTDKMEKGSNLSDVSDTVTARANLGVPSSTEAAGDAVAMAIALG